MTYVKWLTLTVHDQVYLLFQFHAKIVAIYKDCMLSIKITFPTVSIFHVLYVSKFKYRILCTSPLMTFKKWNVEQVTRESRIIRTECMYMNLYKKIRITIFMSWLFLIYSCSYSMYPSSSLPKLRLLMTFYSFWSYIHMYHRYFFYNKVKYVFKNSKSREPL